MNIIKLSTKKFGTKIKNLKFSAKIHVKNWN